MIRIKTNRIFVKIIVNIVIVMLLIIFTITFTDEHVYINYKILGSNFCQTKI